MVAAAVAAAALSICIGAFVMVIDYLFRVVHAAEVFCDDPTSV